MTDFKCQDCSKEFVTREELIAHRQHPCRPSKLIQCDICNKYFPDVSALVSHVMNIHTKEIHVKQTSPIERQEAIINDKIEKEAKKKTYVCEKCDFRFGKKNGLTIHRRSCTGKASTPGNLICNKCKMEKPKIDFYPSDQRVCRKCNQYRNTEARRKNKSVIGPEIEKVSSAPDGWPKVKVSSQSLHCHKCKTTWLTPKPISVCPDCGGSDVSEARVKRLVLKVEAVE